MWLRGVLENTPSDQHGLRRILRSGGSAIRRRRARVSPLGMLLKVITILHPEGNNKGGVQLRGALENSTGSRHSLRRILRSGGSANKLSLYSLVGLQSMWTPTWGGSWLCQRRESNNQGMTPFQATYIDKVMHGYKVDKWYSQSVLASGGSIIYPCKINSLCGTLIVTHDTPRAIIKLVLS